MRKDLTAHNYVVIANDINGLENAWYHHDKKKQKKRHIQIAINWSLFESSQTNFDQNNKFEIYYI